MPIIIGHIAPMLVHRIVKEIQPALRRQLLLHIQIMNVCQIDLGDKSQWLAMGMRPFDGDRQIRHAADFAVTQGRGLLRLQFDFDGGTQSGHQMCPQLAQTKSLKQTGQFCFIHTPLLLSNRISS